MKRQLSLKHKLLAMTTISLLVIFLVLSVLFVRTNRSLRAKALESLDYMADQIEYNLLQEVRAVQTASELIADDPRLIEIIEADYSEDPAGKLQALNTIRSTIFQSTNRSRRRNTVDAIYNLHTGELFNFVNASRMGQETIEPLLAMDITTPGAFNRYRYHWSETTDNFLRGETLGSVRHDTVMLVSRIIHDAARWDYSYVQLFVLPERTLYDCYAGVVPGEAGRVYVLSEELGLLSSTDERAIAARATPEEVLTFAEGGPIDQGTARFEGEKYFVDVSQIELYEQPGAARWTVVLMVPESYATGETTRLYGTFLVVMVLCILFCGVMLVYQYRGFMKPISELDRAMIRVDSGDMSAYVAEPRGNSEAVQMVRRYNRMLKSINHSVAEKLALEQTRQILHMEVLTAQINPHFLYNTLETIIWKALQAGREDIADIASNLGQLYRLSVSRGEMLVPFGQELTHLHCYLEIQQSRFEGQFTYSERLGQGIGDIAVPKIILQPIAENILLHAVPEAERPVHIRLAAKRRGERLYVSISDNGPGMNAARLAHVRESILAGRAAAPAGGRSTGIGLHNIAARLGLYLGAADSLTIHSRAGWGTRVSFTIPIQTPQETDSPFAGT